MLCYNNQIQIYVFFLLFYQLHQSHTNNWQSFATISWLDVWKNNNELQNYESSFCKLPRYIFSSQHFWDFSCIRNSSRFLGQFTNSMKYYCPFQKSYKKKTTNVYMHSKMSISLLVSIFLLFVWLVCILHVTQRPQIQESPLICIKVY